MEVEQLMVMKVLKLGNGTMIMPGTLFPSHETDAIPREIMIEFRKNRGTVQAVKLKSAPAIPVEQEVLQPISEVVEDTLPETSTDATAVEEKTASEEITTVVEAVKQTTAKPKTKRTRKPITTK
jgi:hypothetical protein